MARVYLSNIRKKQSDTSSGNVVNPSPKLKAGINSKSLKDKEAIKQQNQSRKEKNIKGISYVGSHGGNILSILIIILIGVSMIRILYNGSADTVNLGSFLDMLSNAPQVSNSVKSFVQGIEIVGPWLVLDELRIVLNSLIDVLAILVWMASSLVDVIFFIGYFLYWIFI